MRIAILGGTFNPLHIGHLFLAEEVLRLAGYEKILFIPTFIPAHKEVTDPVPAGLRLTMIRESLGAYPEFLVDDCEIRRGGTSFMIDTLHEISAAYDFTGKPGIIIGDDLAPGFPSWKQADEILARADVLVVRRNQATPASCAFPHRSLENKMIDLSSSEIRNRVRENLPVRFLVPEKVNEYIAQYHLYR